MPTPLILPVGDGWPIPHATNSSPATLSVSPSAVGNVLVLGIANNGAASAAVSGVTGGGVTTWAKAEGHLYSGYGDIELWFGAITATGPASISVAGMGLTGSQILACQEFTAGGPATWAVDVAGYIAETALSSPASGNYPSLTPAASGELYVGFLIGLSGTGFACSSSGFASMVAPVAIPQETLMVYSSNTAVGVATLPGWTSSNPPPDYLAAAALLVATRPTSTPSAPVLTAIGSADATAPITVTATYEPTDSWAMSAYALRLKVSGGAYAYLAGALQTTIAWNLLTANPFATFTVTIPANILRNGLTYYLSIATQESGALLDGPFAADISFATTPAPVVTITAPAPVSVGSASPGVSWTHVLAPGASQTNYEIVAESGSYGSVPGSGARIYYTGVVASSATTVFGTVPQPGLYCVFVRITQTGGQVSAWDSQVFVCEATAPPTPTWVSATAGNDPTTGAPRTTLVLSVSDTGFTGQCFLAVLRSDGAYVRGFGWPSGVYTPIPSGGGSFTVYDYETVPGTSYTYTAQLLAWPPLTSLWSASSGSLSANPFYLWDDPSDTWDNAGDTWDSVIPLSQLTTTTNNAWFILDPTNPATAAQFFPGSVTFTDHEAATTFEPLGTRGTLIKSGAGMKGRQGPIAAGVVTQAAYQQLRAVLLNTGTLLLQGPLEQQYVTVFGDRSGVLTPTTAAAPQGNYWDVITFVTVEQTRP